ncbi:hypothetical protein Trydic_g8272 [Trypoxylus dichotomus]
MASVGFRWLDILEKEFDKAFVDLDLTIGELDSEEPDIVYNVRQRLCSLSSCFAQLTHKAQTIFQNSAKIEHSQWNEENHRIPHATTENGINVIGDKLFRATVINPGKNPIKWA